MTTEIEKIVDEIWEILEADPDLAWEIYKILKDRYEKEGSPVKKE